MGSPMYAMEMARILDPKGSLFNGRIVARGRDGYRDALEMADMAAMTKDLDGVLGMESSVLIVDDTPGVWPHHSDNLIVLERWVGSYLDCS